MQFIFRECLQNFRSMAFLFDIYVLFSMSTFGSYISEFENLVFFSRWYWLFVCSILFIRMIWIWKVLNLFIDFNMLVVTWVGSYFYISKRQIFIIKNIFAMKHCVILIYKTNCLCCINSCSIHCILLEMATEVYSSSSGPFKLLTGKWSPYRNIAETTKPILLMDSVCLYIMFGIDHHLNQLCSWIAVESFHSFP